METAIGFLMLALSILSAAQAPGATPEFREKAVSIALIAIGEANKQISPSPATAAARVAEDGTLPGMSIDIFQLAVEEEAIYYRGDKEIQSATVNGVEAEITFSKEMGETSCVNIWEGGSRVGKKCGGFAARIAKPEGTSFAVVLTATDGSTAEREI